MNEIREREAENEAANKVAAEKKAHATRLHEAHLDVGSLPTSIVYIEPELHGFVHDCLLNIHCCILSCTAAHSPWPLNPGVHCDSGQFK